MNSIYFQALSRKIADHLKKGRGKEVIRDKSDVGGEEIDVKADLFNSDVAGKAKHQLDSSRQEVDEEKGWKKLDEGMKEEKEMMKVEASTVVNYSKEEVKNLLRRKDNKVEVGKVILVNFKPAVLKKRKVKVERKRQRWPFTNSRRRSPIFSSVL